MLLLLSAEITECLINRDLPLRKCVAGGCLEPPQDQSSARCLFSLQLMLFRLCFLLARRFACNLRSHSYGYNTDVGHPLEVQTSIFIESVSELKSSKMVRGSPASLPLPARWEIRSPRAHTASAFRRAHFIFCPYCILSSCQEFDVEFLLRQQWKANITACSDYYLQHLTNSAATQPLTSARRAHNSIMISGTDLKGFWTPSLYSPEAKSIQLDPSVVEANGRALHIFVTEKECVFKYHIR